MIKALKVRLRPTPQQEQQLWKAANTARWAYNWALDKQIKHFENTNKLNKIKDGDLRKELTQLKKKDEYKWLFEVSNNVTKQAIKDLCIAIDRFHSESKKHGYKYRSSAIKSGRKLTFRDFEDFPRFKSKRKSEPKFYNDTDTLKVTKTKVYLEKIGWIVLAESKKIPTDTKYTNPRIKHDGKYWYISVGVNIEEAEETLTDVSIGIDIGVKELAVCSHDETFKNINKTERVKKLEKKLAKQQRKVSRKYEMNKDGARFVKTKNIIKVEKQIKLLHRKLSNIRTNHIHQATSKIVKTKPSRVVMETLNIQGMMKNKYLSKAIAQQKLYEFKRQIQYKCKFKGIEFVEADRFYPSSKMCSCCGTIKKDLKLKDRVFKCECGFVLDRDKNASINLASYKLVV